jgi:hypothetical protein
VGVRSNFRGGLARPLLICCADPEIVRRKDVPAVVPVEGLAQFGKEMR